MLMRRALDRFVATFSSADLFQTLQDCATAASRSCMIEQNAKRALENSDYGLVLGFGRARIAGTAPAIFADKRIGQLFLGGGLWPASILTDTYARWRYRAKRDERLMPRRLRFCNGRQGHRPS